MAAQAGGQSYIIKRPRLTRLLDESEARVILLCAPAGYGKTTLAREWAGQRPERVRWIQLTPDAEDPVALQSRVADALEVTAVDAADGWRSNEWDAVTAGRALAAALDSGNTEVAILDDCHFAFNAERSAALTAELIKHPNTRFVITSRTRPAWLTARMEVYGELLVIGSDALAFTPEETRAVLDFARVEHDGVADRAGGWPAVVGLVARRGPKLDDALAPSGDLYNYLAEDVFAAASGDLRETLFAVALAGTGDHRVLQHVVNGDVTSQIREIVARGFASAVPDGAVQMHPLMQSFLLAKLRTSPDVPAEALARRVTSALIAEHRWDECLQTLTAFPDAGMLTTGLRAALADLVSSGRVTTIGRWAELARQAGANDPIVVLAEAEVALREGESRRAIALGEHAGALFRSGEHAARAHLIAARAAHLLSDDETTRRNSVRVSELTADAATREAAQWVEFLRAVEDAQPDTARELIGQFETLADSSPSAKVRLHNARAFYAIEIEGSVDDCLSDLARAYPLLSYVPDPMQTTNFMNLRTSALIYRADYVFALETIDEMEDEAALHGLDFVFDHAACNRASAEIGLRRLTAARRSLAAIGSHAGMSEYLRAQVSVRGAFYRIATGDLRRAEILLRDDPPSLSVMPLIGEWFGLRALIRSGLNDLRNAAGDASRARSCRPSIDARNLGSLAEAVTALQRGRRGARNLASETIHALFVAGALDPIVHAIRVFPQLARIVVVEGALSSQQLTQLLAASRDIAIGRASGLEMPREICKSDELSPREREVYELLVEGRTNREIARTLFISESTTKVHVRHIFEKLGVHTRAEAAAALRKRR